MTLRRPSLATIISQRLASDPRLSAWVSANAGSGKTTVLTRRVIRLLLAGANPSAILCLTFTKAAAANMQNRIFSQLGDWALLGDRELAEAITAITGEAPDISGLRRARQLFAEAIETPGGLKILTIHAFCERVLHLFPFEANVPAQFSVLDDRAARELIETARSALIRQANADPHCPTGRAVALLVEEAGETGFDALLENIITERESLRRFLDEKSEADSAVQLRTVLELNGDETTSAIDQAIDTGGIARDEWPELIEALRHIESKTSQNLAAGFEQAYAAPERQRGDAYRAIFLTQEGEARAPARFLVKDFIKTFPLLAGKIMDELERIRGLLARRKAAAAFERTQAMFTIAGELISLYKVGKARHVALDFDDLVQRTLDLFERAQADWVLYKLDRGIDHILVDEAQDTSPVQWRIVEKLAHEFTAGVSARASGRTIFAVGDEKQSIFSFQGADPAEFSRMRLHFQRKVSDARQRFEAIELKQSFRSTPDIIEAVDHIFADQGNRRGLSYDDAPPLHETVRSADPGRVEIWPIVKPVPLPEMTPWDAPVDSMPNTAPPARLARMIAAEVAKLVAYGDEATGARYHVGDIMILVRSRNALFEAVIRALKFAGVPVAGADRLTLTDSIAVMDLIALASFTLLPVDDLTLATVLKTPLIGLDDTDLLRLAPGRKGSLWESLQQAAGEDPRFATAFRRLSHWQKEAREKSPFAFFADILGRDGGRRTMLARFGLEAADALDEFLRIADDYERSNTTSLQGFIAWLARARAEIKRDMDVVRGEVRVMTVHGAKGLEARVVILADTCTTPDGMHDPKLFQVQSPGRGDGRMIPLYSPRRAADTAVIAQARDAISAANEAEHRRLFYVALTRAEDRLIIAGYEGVRGRRPGNWYDMAADALHAAGARREPMPDCEGERLIWEPTARRPVSSQAVPVIQENAVEPDWLRRIAPAERAGAVTLSPSESLASDGAQTTASGMDMDSHALRRGSLIHAMLHNLANLPVAVRQERARAFLLRSAPEWRDDHEAWIAEVMKVFNAPALAPFFAAGSRPEVALTGRLERAGRPDILINGRIDRLVLLPDAVWIADFKTGTRPPASLAEVPGAYAGQLALYRHLIMRLYPERPVRAFLVWTATATAMELPAAMLEKAVDDVAGSPLA